MARKMKRRFDDGGEVADIVVRGARTQAPNMVSDFRLAPSSGGMGATGLSGLGSGVGYGANSQRLAQLNPPMAPEQRSTFGPAVISQPQSTLGNLVGARSPKGYGASFRTGFAKGGKADGEPTGGKKKSKAKRYAAGGSTASKRADGCATKGKTKGRFV